jgi:hypothetical protein
VASKKATGPVSAFSETRARGDQRGSSIIFNANEAIAGKQPKSDTRNRRKGGRGIRLFLRSQFLSLSEVVTRYNRDIPTLRLIGERRGVPFPRPMLIAANAVGPQLEHWLFVKLILWELALVVVGLLPLGQTS